MQMCKENEIVSSSLTDPLPNATNLHIDFMHNIDSAKKSCDESSNTQSKSSIHLLQQTIESLFQDLSKVNIENLLTFWLTLSASESELNGKEPSSPSLCLQEETINYLLDTLIDYPFMTVKLWYLTFKMFTALLHYSKASPLTSSSSCVNFVTKDSLYKLIYKLLSSEQELVGDECCCSLIEFLKKLSDSIYDTQQECHLKKRLFSILCKSIENDGCITRSQGPIDAQVAFVEYLITEDLVKTYDLNQFDNEESKEYEQQKDETNRAYEDMVKKYFDFLSKLVLHHIYIYPRLSVKGTASPRSCFSGVLTTLLCGPPGVYSGDNNNISKKKTSLFDTSMPNFSLYSSSSQNFNSIPFQSPYIYHSSQGNYGAQSNHHHHQQQQQHQGNTTNSIQSVLCNRDMLICLLLKCAVNLITDIKLNEINSSTRNGNRNNKKKKFENAEEAIKSKPL
jgi:hypothetical protein